MESGHWNDYRIFISFLVQDRKMCCYKCWTKQWPLWNKRTEWCICNSVSTNKLCMTKQPFAWSNNPFYVIDQLFCLTKQLVLSEPTISTNVWKQPLQNQIIQVQSRINYSASKVFRILQWNLRASVQGFADSETATSRFFRVDSNWAINHAGVDQSCCYVTSKWTVCVCNILFLTRCGASSDVPQ